MCDLHDEHVSLPPLEADEYRLDTARVRGFVADVRDRIAAAESPSLACELISPLFAELLADRDWLPSAYQEPAVDGGMGGGIGQWLVFRAADRSLSLFSLVVPPGAMTPVHDHLAWGLVGVYRGVQDEEFYRPGTGGSRSCDGVRSTRVTSTRCCRRAMTCTACGRPPRRRRCRSTCSRTTLVASGVIRSTSKPGHPVRSARGT